MSEIFAGTQVLIPRRTGGRPRTTDTNPHSQQDQPALHQALEWLVERAFKLDEVLTRPSLRAPAGTLGFSLLEPFAKGPPEAFLLDREFAHLHPPVDGSMHLTLPPAIRELAIAQEWAEPHPLAGRPTVSPYVVMVYAPRSIEEADVVYQLLQESWAFARGDTPIT